MEGNEIMGMKGICNAGPCQWRAMAMRVEGS